jgi:hypothetical protein
MNGRLSHLPSSLRFSVALAASFGYPAATELAASLSGLVQADDDMPGHVGCMRSGDSRLLQGVTLLRRRSGHVRRTRWDGL